MNATITFILEEALSNISGTYFVIKLRTDEGENYNIVPSSDCNTYNSWLKIADLGIGTKLEGLKHSQTKNGRKFFNKRVLPTNIKNI